MEYLFFVDAETDGLYGSFLSVGIIVTDQECREIERFYYGINKARMVVTDAWTREHVLPILGEYEICESEEELLDRVWAAWMKYHDSAFAIADVTYPVEARLFRRCVEKDIAVRKLMGPFPFLDLSSLLYARGYEPLADRKNLSRYDHGPQHNALFDVEMEVQIYRNIILGRKTKDERI